MLIDYLLLNFEILIFFSLSLIIVGFLLLFFFQSQKFQQNKVSIIEHANTFKKNNIEMKDYLISIGNILDQQKNEILKITDKISFIEKEISRLGSIKGSEDMLTTAIEMVRKGETKESIKNNTSLKDDEIEAIYTYYRK